MMAASPGAEDSFELMADMAETRDSLVGPGHSNDISKTKRQGDFNFSSLWRKPKLSRRLHRSSTDHVKLDSPMIGLPDSDTPRKASKRLSFKDRESFETMGSSHLSELDESRDVIPVIMKREGWNFSREVPQGYDETNSRSSSAKIRRDMNPKIFLTPSPTKSYATHSPCQGADRGTAAEDNDSDEVFTLIRSNGYKSRSSHSRESYPRNTDKEVAAVPSPRRELNVDGREISTNQGMMQHVEVYDGEYLSNDAVLSSISEDSGDSRQNNNHRNKTLGPKKCNLAGPDFMETDNKVDAPETSFAARMKFFQSKQMESKNFEKIKFVPIKRLPSQAATSTTDATTSTQTRTDTNVDGEVRQNEAAKKDCSSRSTPKRNLDERDVLRQRKDCESDSKRMLNTQAVNQSNGATTFSPGSFVEKPFVNSGANRFGVTLGRRHPSLQKLQNQELPQPSSFHPVLNTSHTEKEQTLIHLKDVDSKFVQVPFCVEENRRSTLVSQKDTRLSPRKSSKSMSVLERTKMFEMSKSSISKVTGPICASQKTSLSSQQCKNGIVADIHTCDKCGSEIKVPLEASYGIGNVTEDETKKDVRRSLFGKVIDKEAGSENRYGSDDDSEDDITVVRDRRATLKSAPRELHRAVLETYEEPTRMGTAANSKAKDSSMAGLLKSLPKSSFDQNFARGFKPTEQIPFYNKQTTEKQRRGLQNWVKRDLTQKSDLPHNHPDVVTVDDDFLAKDDTSGFYSTSESSRQVVCPPPDRTPYYIKQQRGQSRDRSDDSSVESSLQQSITAWKQRRCNSTSHPSSKSNTVPEFQQITPARYDVNLRGHEPTKDGSVPFLNHSSPKWRAQNPLYNPHDRRQSNTSALSCSISEKLAVYQRSSTSGKIWRPSNKASSTRNSAERLSHAERRKSSRKSSLSLQDVVENRQLMEAEKRRSSIFGSVVGGTPQNTTVETNENVRPSDLLKRKTTESSEPTSPSPLLYRRGFTTCAVRQSSSKAGKSQDIRCF